MSRTNGFVVFSTRAVFDTQHSIAKSLLGYPVPARNGATRSLDNTKIQTVNITDALSHRTDVTVAAYIDDNWPRSIRIGFVYRDASEIPEYWLEMDPDIYPGPTSAPSVAKSI